MSPMLRRPVISLTSLAFFAGAWFLFAIQIGDPQILPRPDRLLVPFWSELQSGDLTFHLSQTLKRVLFAFLLAMVLGAILGFVLGCSDQVNEWLDPWLVLFLNLPALVLIVLCYLWVGLTEIAAIVAVTINKVPNVAVIIREGTRALSADIKALARVYQLGFARRFLHLEFPLLAPYFTAAARSGIAIIWKIVLVVELLGRSNGIGFQIHLYFQLFDVGMVLVYAISFILVMLAFEWLVLQPCERVANQWRIA
mgnify:CR=1 FL=1